jgi:hypothetical protein
MEAVERIIISNDWLTFTFLGIGLMLFVVNYLDQDRLRQLMVLPFNSLYFSMYENTSDTLLKGFTIFLFIASNLTLSIFLYLLIQNLYPNVLSNTRNPFLILMGLIMLYWIFRFLMGLFVAWVFNLQSVQRPIVYIKMSYYFSINIYLLVFVLFGVYYFDWQGSYILFVLGIYTILLSIRYFQFVKSLNRITFVKLFYFILYLCTLEIAPLLLVYKWSLG